MAICASGAALIITLLLGHIFNAAINQIDSVERDYRNMMELKARAEAADVAKSQVHLKTLHIYFLFLSFFTIITKKLSYFFLFYCSFLQRFHMKSGPR